MQAETDTETVKMGTAPDPPDSPVEVEEELGPTLRRISTACSYDPPAEKKVEEHPEIENKAERGLDPSEYQITDSSSNLRSSQSSKHFGGALVLYEPQTSTESASSPDPEEDNPTKTAPTKGPQGVIVLEQGTTKEGGSDPMKSDGDDQLALKPAADAENTLQDMRFGFDHCYVTVPCKERLSVLFATLRRSSDRKVIVICSSWESAKYHAILFQQLEMLHVYDMHEHMKGGGVARAYEDFTYQYPGILFASDIAMREFEIPPNVDYVVQYEPTMNPTDYVYRMSNAKIYRTSAHKALLFLSPEEMHFLEYFDHIQNRELEARKVAEFQGSAEKLVTKHSELNDHAWKAFRAYMLGYENHTHSDIYDHSKIDEAGIRKSFGQPHLPDEAAKYFVGLDNGSTRAKKEKGDEESKDQSTKPKHWSDKQKTWRSTNIKPWATREKKTWKHSHNVQSKHA